MTKDEVLALALEIKRHNMGQLTFANAMLASFGSTSPPGRQLDKFPTLNSHVLYVLEDFPAVRHLSLSEIHGPQPNAPPSTAAANMLANPHTRRSGRRVPMPAATRHAAKAYASERVELLGRVLAKLPETNPWTQPTQRAMLKRELRSWSLMRDWLVEPP